MDQLFQRYKPIKLHYTSCSPIYTSDPSATPIILIHGFFATSSSWSKVKFQICNKTKRKVYTVDLRNHGKSEQVDEMTVKHMSADILQFMKNEKIERASFIGHSAGGRIAMELALHKPEVVQNLIVEDIAISDVSSDKYSAVVTFTKHFRKGVEALPATLSETAAQKMMTRMAAKHLPEISATVPSLFYKSKTGEFKLFCNMEVLTDAMSKPEQLRNDLAGDPTYTGKVLYIKGENSIVPIDEDRGTILKHFPNARFVTIKGVYHVAHFENASAFVQVVIDFLSEN